jgi:tetratricopeptide (TPR) repeat protein
MAMSGGMTGGMKYVGKIKEALQKSVELAPTNYDMRRDLVQFYLQAPGIAGGSVRRATENAEAFSKIDPFRGQLLMADVLAYDKKFERAEATLHALKPADTEQADMLSASQASLGFSMINNEQLARAQALFERLVGQRATNAMAHFGLGRALLEQKQVDAAISAMERALQIDPKINAHYRLGIAYQTRGDKSKAISLFNQFLSYATSGRAAEDARKRLEELKRG